MAISNVFCFHNIESNAHNICIYVIFSKNNSICIDRETLMHAVNSVRKSDRISFRFCRYLTKWICQHALHDAKWFTKQRKKSSLISINCKVQCDACTLVRPLFIPNMRCMCCYSDLSLLPTYSWWVWACVCVHALCSGIKSQWNSYCE